MTELPPAWRPVTEAELLRAAEAGLLNEGTSRLELKREIETGQRANKELARDLASLAVAGGLLLLGVVDEAARIPGDPLSALNPIDLSGLPERVEQVALTRCDPPLSVRCVEIVSSSGHGYLAVHVPLSPQAPYMVDGRYLGRGERTKRNLTDPEVVALHARRELLDRDAGQALDEHVDRDPWSQANKPRDAAHLYFVAEPRHASASMLLDVVNGGGNGPANTLMGLVRKRANETPRFHSLWAPDFDSATNFARRSDGWALCGHGFGPGRTFSADMREDDFIEIELSEKGVIRLCCGRASDLLKSDSNQLLFDVLIAGLVWRSLGLAADMSEATGYGGQWALGLAVSGLAGKGSFVLRGRLRGSDAPLYPDDDYRELTCATTEELAANPSRVTHASWVDSCEHSELTNTAS